MRATLIAISNSKLAYSDNSLIYGWRKAEISRRKARLDAKSMTSGGPKQYCVNPLEFLLARLVAAPPVLQTDEVGQILSRIIVFLEDKDLPTAYSKWFFEGVEQFVRSNERRARMNAWFTIRALKDDNPLAADLQKRLETDGTYARVEKELKDYFDSFGPPQSELRKRLVENLKRTTRRQINEAVTGNIHSPILVSTREQQKEKEIANIAKEAYRLERDGKLQEALLYYEQALALKSIDKETDRAIRFAKSNCHTLLEQNEEALEILIGLCKEKSLDATYHSARGISLMKLGKLNEAQLAMDKALELDPNRPTTLFNKASLLFSMNRIREGALLLDQTLEKNPDHPALRAYHNEFAERFACAAVEALDKREIALASRFAARATELNPLSPLALSATGTVMTEKGRFEEALSYYQQALQVQPDFLPAIHRSARTLALLGRIPDAIRRLEQIVKQDSDAAMVWNDLGTCCAQAGMWDKALLCLERATAFGPDHPIHWSNLGGIYLQTGQSEKDFEQALKHFDRALNLDHNHLQAMFGRGAALYYLGRYREASIQLNALLRLAPSFPQAADLIQRSEKAERERR